MLDNNVKHVNFVALLVGLAARAVVADIVVDALNAEKKPEE